MTPKKSIIRYCMVRLWSIYCLAGSQLILAQDQSIMSDQAEVLTRATSIAQSEEVVRSVKPTRPVTSIRLKQATPVLSGTQATAITRTVPSVASTDIGTADKSLNESLILNSGFGYSHEGSYAAVSKKEVLTKVVLGLALVLGVIGLLAWLSKKIGIQRLVNHKKIRLRESINVSSKEKLILVDFAGESLLLGVGGGRITLIKSMPELPAAQSEPVKPSLGAKNALDFQHKLNEFLLKGGQS